MIGGLFRVIYMMPKAQNVFAEHFEEPIIGLDNALRTMRTLIDFSSYQYRIGWRGMPDSDKVFIECWIDGKWISFKSYYQQFILLEQDLHDLVQPYEYMILNHMGVHV